ncbi:hypothetical protein SFRURICE_002621 [Spodoptera frugiperda]|nr:hypothetical protein SFRURICE_002621 [Spodoptera frugiperda]
MVKRSIMLKMADACADSSKQTRFHEMHVQRHNNVSILYADIVNFTPLSERLSASDLVKTLNELFGRFDQIAQTKEPQPYTPEIAAIPVNQDLQKIRRVSET